MALRAIRLTLAVAVLALVAVLVRVEPASACSCATDTGPAAAYARAEVAFGGRVESTTTTLFGGEHRFVLTVDRVYKGEIADRVTVATPPYGSCGLSLHRHRYYVLFAPRRTPTRVEVALCDGVEAGRTDRFGAGHAPVPSPPQRRVLPWVVVDIGIGVALVAAAVVFVRYRARRRRADAAETRL